MKKQTNKKLIFNKSVVTELQNEALGKINGGTGELGCFLCIRSSNGPGNMTIVEQSFKL